MARGPGFLVWNPSRALPTVQHETLERAEAEAARLRVANPGETFFVMAPVRTPGARAVARALSDGLAQGRAEMRGDVMAAEARSDRLWEEKRVLERSIAAARPILEDAAEHQATVADCLLWFDGFQAAHAHREGWERPHTPAREKLQRLNGALQRVMRAASPLDTDDEEIPF
jgi:hypothetical protein